jgi:hypothetical protein
MNKALFISLVLVTSNASAFIAAKADSNLLTESALTTSSITAATTFGTPIAIVRKTSDQYIDCLKEFKKDSNSYKLWGALSSVLVAAVAGPIKGTVDGAKNAVRYSFSKPFSKDAFSLGNLEGPDSQTAKTSVKFDPEKRESQPWGTPR